jgi:hypothetical protein
VIIGFVLPSVLLLIFQTFNAFYEVSILQSKYLIL